MTQYRNLIRAVAIALLAAAPLSAEAAPAAPAPAAGFEKRGPILFPRAAAPAPGPPTP